MRFGYHIDRYQATAGDPATIYPNVRAAAQWAEAQGFDLFTLTDHVRQFPRIGPVDDPLMESWLTLAAVANATSRISLGTLVTNVASRNPALLAKMTSTLDLISGGRAMLGIGGGGYREESESFGYRYLPARTLIAQVSEAVRIARALWTQPRVTFAGQHFSLHDAVLEPKPIHLPRVLIGGSGEQYTLRVVAELADTCNFVSLTSAEVPQKLAVLEGHCKAIGRDRQEIEVSVLVPVTLALSSAQAMEKWRALDPANLRTRPGIVGTPDEAIDAIKAYERVGVQMLILVPAAGDRETRDLLAATVLPTFVSK
jgi:alkanesulfonate monooxygenase SsuD/methylene tetrahydromethanopterin reductase-like flavin-dependent oxidoreductase (luciferase family)